ncbi:TPA: ATP-binding protein [Citrobacter koseri]|uniref:AAA family ATPase n=1 Tax=Citrobacter koseri TaxID=545 RepID=UPI0018E12B74|nr:AAA family ATPase [Citrobacter koseri]MBI0678943.1 ATP-binding protein [Citrobacter koseri]HAU5603647.1 ATP-binding protein [Citrobacter koseri]HDQ2605562.1 AAA family ATPase [Citrobacter koseri]
MAQNIKTKLNKIVIDKFRALKNVKIEFGDHITVICGKNGTSKSSILGISAQIFSFDKDYIKDEDLNYRQITNEVFKSQYSEHFRISNNFDIPGSMKVGIDLHDGYTNQAATARLELMKRGTSSRPVVRNNSTASSGSNTSRNFTHPVIFLSLKRLYPIAAREYNISSFNYLNDHQQDFIALTNELLNRSSSLATGTDGTIVSAVAHGENYDQDSVSAGEDNAGQIILALMSFKKLKEEYPDYRGGLLLIDEADAGLFPTAQINLLKMLDRECKDLNLQVVMTSHSPLLIEYAYEQSQLFRKRYKTIYLSNTYGDVQVMNDWSWQKINSDINTKTIDTSSGISLPRINVYFEDREAADLFATLMNRQPIKKFVTPLPDITLGCSNYLQLINKKVTEFSEKSIICLDADQTSKINSSHKTVVLLPGELPPDQLIFEYLYNLPADHSFWKNDINFSRDHFTNAAREVLRELAINGSSVDVKERLASYRGEKTPREFFKRFYKNVEIQKLIRAGEKPYNPWKHWIENNPEQTNKFLENFCAAIHNVMKVGYAVDSAKLDVLKVKAKKV